MAHQPPLPASAAVPASEKRTVFKPALSNPAILGFPTTSASNHKAIFSKLTELLLPLKEYKSSSKTQRNNIRRRSKRKKKNNKTCQDTDGPKNHNCQPTQQTVTTTSTPQHPQEKAVEALKLQLKSINRANLNQNTMEQICKSPGLDKLAPEWLKDLKLGINAVSEALEQEIHYYEAEYLSVMQNKSLKGKNIKAEPLSHSSSREILAHKISLVFCCAADIQPIHCVSHLPSLVYLLNMRKATLHKEIERQFQRVRLVSLPQGSETFVANIFGLKRLGAFAISLNSPYFVDFTKFIADVLPDVDTFNGLQTNNPPNIPIIPAKRNLLDLGSSAGTNSARLNPLQVKFIKTTIPVPKQKKKP